MTWYKATQADGTDYHTGTILYEVGKRVRPAQTDRRTLCGPGVLHASTSPEKAVSYNGRWPWRLFEVEGRPFLTDDADPHKAGFKQLQVVKEVPAYLAFGPNGVLVGRVIDKIADLEAQQIRDLAASRAASLGASWDASWGATLGASWDALRAASVADLVGQHGLTADHIRTLYGPWQQVVGDPDIEELLT